MTSTLESKKHSPRSIKRATIVTHGKAPTIGPALARVERVAREHGVKLIFPQEEREKHGLENGGPDPRGADIAVVLGGDGTMLRALHTFLGTDVPVIGVNFGRVGFLASIQPDQLESRLARVFEGDYVVVELPTLEAEVEGKTFVAVNDVVATSSILGRMVELQWAVGGEDLGRIACDGIICATPSGSTAYNLSNGGPVLVRGLEAMVVTFVAPHSLHARPLVVALCLAALAATSSGFAFTLGRLAGGVTRAETVKHVGRLVDATDLPVSVDLENGYDARPAGVAEAIARVADAGAVGGSIEDYDPSGFIYPLPQAVERVAAALEAARALPFPFTLTARAENHIRGNPDLVDTVVRLRAFEEAGADVLYAPGLRTGEEIRAVCEAVTSPV